jgi:putative effector of murein hydrolase LrgA (UPF0299 family)
MNRNRWLSWFIAAVMVLSLLCMLSQTATACPTCKNGLMEGDEASQRMIQGYFWSILFMMSMPFAILIGVGGYMYREVKRAQAKTIADHNSAAGAAEAAPSSAPGDEPRSSPR